MRIRLSIRSIVLEVRQHVDGTSVLLHAEQKCGPRKRTLLEIYARRAGHSMDARRSHQSRYSVLGACVSSAHIRNKACSP
jgi:hypothetical protein